MESYIFLKYDTTRSERYLFRSKYVPNTDILVLFDIEKWKALKRNEQLNISTLYYGIPGVSVSYWPHAKLFHLTVQHNMITYTMD